RTREEVRFATGELCFACYRSRERARRRAAEEDRHTPSGRQRNEQAKLLKHYSAIQNALIGLGATVPPTKRDPAACQNNSARQARADLGSDRARPCEIHQH